ncbi:hypothetical protein GALMADRAFT_133777 [Galerina marginata CBS 339.88]|uniref:Uncharacterized protein n=1 Tax=Galerina marginata (strain CBS 339.88) TaxID=685588 RepID=A0A067TQC0_GALM3|nr:hypothetical protein GALMADRAFT_133777 [Galerina marginata CBS 339.88]
MEPVTGDPELASEMLSLLNKELKAARLRIAELELKCNNATDAQVDQFKERAEAAELSMNILQKNFEELGAENELLRVAIEDIRDSKIGVKKENFDHRINIKKMIDKSTSAINEPDLEHVQDLEAALERYYGKYKAEKEARKGLSQTIRELEEQINLLRIVNENLHRECEEIHPSLPVSNREIKTCSPLPQTPGRRDFDEYMSHLPKYNGRPRVKNIHPVYGQGLDLKAYLALDPRTSRWSTNFLYIPNLLVWCPDLENALAVGPVNIFDESKGKWSKASIFESIDEEKGFALFYASRGMILYGGTYKAINFRKWNSEGCPMYDDSKAVSVGALADATVAKTNGARSHSSFISIIKGLYLDKILNVETLGLHCVGFDHNLYARLKERYEGTLSVVLPETNDQESKGAEPPSSNTMAPGSTKRPQNKRQRTG